MDESKMSNLSKKDMWKQDESKNGDAIIAIAEDGSVKLIVILTNDYWKEEAARMGEELCEYQFTEPSTGLWYANVSAAGGNHYGYQGDCFYVKWKLVKPLYQIVMDYYISLTVTSYYFNRNVFCAITDEGGFVEFDPFVGCAIKQSDEEYFNKAIAPTVIGHKFVLKSLTPSPEEVIFTTWKKDEQWGEYLKSKCG
jgi:hypothetical protein